jgi:hypothetical protein
MTLRHMFYRAVVKGYFAKTEERYALYLEMRKLGHVWD